jgi:gluconolactonase
MHSPIRLVISAALTLGLVSVACSQSPGATEAGSPVADGGDPGEAGSSGGRSGSGSSGSPGTGSGFSGSSSGGGPPAGSSSGPIGGSSGTSVRDASVIADAQSEATAKPAPEAGSGRLSGICPAGPFPSNPIPSGAAPTRIAGVPPPDLGGTIDQMGYGFSTIEGPVWTATGLLVSEYPGSPNPPPSRIIQIATSGVVTVVGPAAWNPGTNGLAVDGSGNLYGAVHGDGSISRIDIVNGTRTPIAAQYMGKPFNAPNDLAVRSDGNIYFSDTTGFQSPNPPPQSQERVYRIAAGSNVVSVVDPLPGAQPLNHPNGVTLSLDESVLYVSSNSVIYAYPVMSDGTTGPRPSTPFSTLNVDGMTIDCAGNLYGAIIGSGGGPGIVQVFASSGAPLGQILVNGVYSVTNVAFGGADHKTLYITAQGTGGGNMPIGPQAQGVYQVTLNIPGLPY